MVNRRQTECKQVYLELPRCEGGKDCVAGLMLNGESILQKVSAMTGQTTELIQQTPSAKLFAHLKSADLWR